MASRRGYSALTWPNSDSIQAWSVGVPGRPKCWWMAHSAMKSQVDPGVICGLLSLIASRIGRVGSSQARSTVPSRRAATCSMRPSASSAWQKAAWTWTLVSSLLTTSHSHLREIRSSITVTAVLALVKWVVSKIHNIPGWYSTQSGNAGAPSGRVGAAAAAAALGQQHPPYGGGRHPHPLQVRAAVDELARGAVDLAPLVEQRDDLGDLLGQQLMDRPAARRRVLQQVGGATPQPSPRAPLAQLQRRARRPHRPSLVDGMIEQGQQPSLVAASTRGGTRPLSPNALFSLHQQQLDGQLLERLPKPGRLGSGGLQLQVAPGRLHARLGGGQGLQRGLAGASWIRMIVERSTSKRSAASEIVVSWRSSCRQISYFCDGDKNRLARRPIRSVPRSGSGMISSSCSGQQPEQMLADPPLDLCHEVRRKPASAA
jgi:hypothetical protein